MTNAPEREPTGVEICRLHNIPNVGPRAPTTTTSSRDFVTTPFADCNHASATTHQGNCSAFYVQCTSCRWMVEFYPRVETSRHLVGPGMIRVERVYGDLSSVIRARQEQSRRTAAAASARGKKTPDADTNPGPTEAPKQTDGTKPAAPPRGATPLVTRSRHPQRNLDALNIDGRAPEPSSADAHGARLLRPKARAAPSPVIQRAEEMQVPESDASSMSISDTSIRSAMAGSAKTRRPTPAATRRVKWHNIAEASIDEGEQSSGEDPDHEEGRPSEPAGSHAPREALLAMRTLASLPEATQDTTRLLDQLEAHLAATNAAAALAEEDLPSPIREPQSRSP